MQLRKEAGIGRGWLLLHYGTAPVDTCRAQNRGSHDYLRAHKGSRRMSRPLICLLYTSPSPRDQRGSRMPSSA